MKLEELEKKYEELGKEIDKLKKSGKKRWRAEKNGYYYYIGGDGIVYVSEDKYGNIDNFKYLSGNYYKTEEEGERAVRRNLLIQKYKDFIDEITEELIDWNDTEQNKYCLMWVLNAKQEFCTWYKAQGSLYTTNENLLELARERFTEEELRVIIGVEINETHWGIG